MFSRPRLLEDLRGYDRAKLAGDVSAGVTVAAVALPLAMGFAMPRRVVLLSTFER